MSWVGFEPDRSGLPYENEACERNAKQMERSGRNVPQFQVSSSIYVIRFICLLDPFIHGIPVKRHEVEHLTHSAPNSVTIDGFQL